jgi:hypothetical protein
MAEGSVVMRNVRSEFREAAVMAKYSARQREIQGIIKKLGPVVDRYESLGVLAEVHQILDRRKITSPLLEVKGEKPALATSTSLRRDLRKVERGYRAEVKEIVNEEFEHSPSGNTAHGLGLLATSVGVIVSMGGHFAYGIPTAVVGVALLIKGTNQDARYVWRNISTFERLARESTLKDGGMPVR